MRELRKFRQGQVEEKRAQEEMESEEERTRHLHNMALLKVTSTLLLYTDHNNSLTMYVISQVNY